MPKYQHRIDLHRLFLVEPRGNTLIVSPKGDPAGFANMNFNIEHAAILALLGKEKYQNVIVDLSASNYFGAKILGAFSEWAEIVYAKNGRFAVCDISEDMKELIHIFQFDVQWKQFKTLDEATNLLVKETFGEQLRYHWKAMVFVACACVIVGLSFLPWNQWYAYYINQKDYEIVASIWADLEKLKEANAPPIEWRKLQNRAHRELKPIVPTLLKRSSTKTPQEQAAQYLLFASRDNILKHLLVQKDRMDQSRPLGPEKEQYWIRAGTYIERARVIMAGGNPRDVKMPKYTPYKIGSAANGGSNTQTPTEVSDEPMPNPTVHKPAIAESPTRYPYPHSTDP